MPLASFEVPNWPPFLLLSKEAKKKSEGTIMLQQDIKNGRMNKE
jgi:hypothetical protein